MRRTSIILEEEQYQYLKQHVAIAFGNKLLASELTQIVSVTAEDQKEAWKIFKKFKDQEFSFTDCTSFAVMKRLGLSRVLTVDKHFRVMGFVLVI